LAKDSEKNLPHTIPQEMLLGRENLIKKYLRGEGIEIGALHYPVKLHENVKAKYVDRYDISGLRSQYPELKNFDLVKVDIIDDGEKLTKINEDSLDFIISSHFLEHTQNPIQTIETHLSKIKIGGVLYYAIPDKWMGFDIDRPLTTFEHILKDFQNGPSISYVDHLNEWSALVNKTAPEKREEQVKKLMGIKYSIHFHVWDGSSFKNFLDQTNLLLGNPFKILEFVRNDTEHIAILEKIAEPHLKGYSNY